MRTSMLVSLLTITAAAQLNGCATTETETAISGDDPGEISSVEGEESVAEAASDLSPARVIPIRFVHLLPDASCSAADPCSDGASTRQIQAAVAKANEVYEPAGIKLWIKSEEFINAPLLSNINVSFYWSDIKGELRKIYPNMPSNAYYSNDLKNARYWAKAAGTFYGNDDEIVVHIWPGGSSTSDGAFPESGRAIRFMAGHFAGAQISDSGFQSALPILAHELGHYFGLRHTFELPWGTNPATYDEWTGVDRYDELLCFDPLSIPTTPAAAASCSTYTMLDPYCGTTPQGAGQPKCTTPAGTFNAGSSTIDGLFRQVPGVTHAPPDSYAYAANVMGYWDTNNWSVDPAAPAFVSESQIAIMDSYLTLPMLYSDIDGFLRLDGTYPLGMVPNAAFNRRMFHGSYSDDFLSFGASTSYSGARFSFASYAKPVAGTGYEPISADFDQDGNDDILWYDPTSTTARFWWGRDDRGFDLDDRAGFFAETGYTVFAGDFDGDGDVDLFLYKPGSGQDRIKIKTYARVFGPSSTDVLKTVNGTFTPLVGNFDGTGGDDVYWYSSANAEVNRWFATGGYNFQAFDHVPVPSSGATPIVGDFDGNAADDVFWYVPGGSSGEKIWFGPQSGATNSHLVTSNVTGTYEPLAGDFDGDGRSDILWDKKNDRGDAIWGGNADKTFDKGSSDLNDTSATHTGKVSFYGAFDPVSGDFDGDGSADVMWYRE